MSEEKQTTPEKNYQGFFDTCENSDKTREKLISELKKIGTPLKKPLDLYIKYKNSEITTPENIQIIINQIIDLLKEYLEIKYIKFGEYPNSLTDLYLPFLSITINRSFLLIQSETNFRELIEPEIMKYLFEKAFSKTKETPNSALTKNMDQVKKNTSGALQQ